MITVPILLLFAPFPLLVVAQSCENAGVVNGSSCDCPTGFGGSNCSQPACGGNIFQGTNRSLTPINSNGFANLTAAGCSCQSGWTGTGCNVCQTASACASGYSSTTSGSSTSSSGLTGLNDGQNRTLVCNNSPRVWAAGQLSCNVNNPTLQALYPLNSVLNIERTLNSSLSPIPNTTSFGSAGSVYAQLFYDGVEQFYCSADSCTQDLSSGSNGSSSWSCQNLSCTCRSGTSFCGAVHVSDLTSAINGLSGALTISCNPLDQSTNTASCSFQQSTLQSLFGASGLTMEGCAFGECVGQYVIDDNGNLASSTSVTSHTHLSGGVIAGLAVVGAFFLAAVTYLAFGVLLQRRARKSSDNGLGNGNIPVVWSDISYFVSTDQSFFGGFGKKKCDDGDGTKVVLDSVSGRVLPGQMMAILGPSGAGKTTLVDILAQKPKSGRVTGTISFPGATKPRIGFVPQQDVLPPMLTVFEALLFAARLRLPESVSDSEKQSRVLSIMDKLGISELKDSRIGWGDAGGGKARGISGGEMRRVSIGLELIASPDVLILDEPTSGLDSVSAARVANLLHDIAHDTQHPTAVIASIHQPSSRLYQTFDQILVLSHGHTLYSGPGCFAPVDYFAAVAPGAAPPCPQGYNVADYLLEVASDPPLALIQQGRNRDLPDSSDKAEGISHSNTSFNEVSVEKGLLVAPAVKRAQSTYATTFLTQLQRLSGREWKILQRDKTLFLTHLGIACVLGVFCGGLYFQTGITIAGFQSRIGCLFFLGALIAFSSLSALYNMVEIRPLFLRERSSSYYSPTTWLLSRFLFDVIPLRVIPTIVVSTITYWMAGLAGDAAHYFKFLLILFLYTLAITLFNFLLGALFRNGGVAILLSALSALYQMTFAGFFVHLGAIPPVLRWLQWLCPLKYCLEALSVNEVGSGLMIEDSLEGVPVNVSATLIMNLLFGFGSNNYYRDVLVLFAFIAGFGLGVIGVVWFKVRERR
ncbi:ABC transporter [Guyanagaster necrorhizus]|uniref:ABC transporter n=1 Tax=Guyanagaster necrorhizus TaxID=856835 RepID=A0A9P7W620_9AGAR|nr:ABC transporter [Guyanagaster necrorhizus MCA 3950]KAG7453130.1 ABC transporter [Guyanagaster necrorhizus MCA 3950]